jgi:transcriptional regulator with XRE-family HTH domain
MSGWEAGLDDEEAGAVMRTVTRQLKLWREAAGLTQAEFGAAIKYGEEMVSCVERGRRIPRPEYLDAADEVLGASCGFSRALAKLQRAARPSACRLLRRVPTSAARGL